MRSRIRWKTTIYAQAAPVPHEFELRQVEAPTAQGAE